MTTRRNTTTNELFPLSDLEAILCAGNAKQRRAALLQDQAIAPLPLNSSPIPVTVSMLETVATHPNNKQSANANQKADFSPLDTAKDWFKRVLKAQHASIAQAQEYLWQAIKDRHADRQILIAAHQASAACISRLEDILLTMNIQNKVNA